MTQPALALGDRETVADLITYVQRARTIEVDGAIRLQASGTTLAAWVGVRKGRGLLGEGTVVGLRVIPLASTVTEDVDVVVPLAAVADRLAHQRHEEAPILEIPPMTVRTSWAAVSPPRSGWAPLGTIGVPVLIESAKAGIAEIATGTPEGAGAAAVETLQDKVWSRAVDGAPAEADGLPSGVALGVYALGFGIGSEAAVYGTARWHRVSTRVGHVLVR